MEDLEKLLEIPIEEVIGWNHKSYNKLLSKIRKEGDLAKIAKASLYYAKSVDIFGYSTTLQKAKVWAIAANDSRKAGKKCSLIYRLSADYYSQVSCNEEASDNYRLAAKIGKEEGETVSVIREYYKKCRVLYEASGNKKAASKVYIIENDLVFSEAKGIEKGSLLFSKLFSVYGERPSRILIWAGLSILICAICYFLFGIESEESVIYSIPSSLYFSVVTFTTLGYGDYAPAGSITRFIAALQALSGLFFTSFFLATFIKKYSR